MGGGRRDFSEHGERRGLRGQGATAVPRCLSLSLKGALRFRRLHSALALGVCLISPRIVSRPAALGVSSHYSRLLLHTRIFEGEASSCSANHGSGGEGWLPRQTRNVPAPRPRTAPAGGEGRSRGGGGGCYSCILCINKFYNLCERSKKEEGNGKSGINFFLLLGAHFLYLFFLLDVETPIKVSVDT